MYSPLRLKRRASFLLVHLLRRLLLKNTAFLNNYNYHCCVILYLLFDILILVYSCNEYKENQIKSNYDDDSIMLCLLHCEALQ